MRLFRIEREKYLQAVLTGAGAAATSSGRWNVKHTPLVYTAESRSLAFLEVLVHLDAAMDLPSDRFMVELEVPPDCQVLKLSEVELSNGWDAPIPGDLTRSIGTPFVASMPAPLLHVPSAIVAGEFNCLINPRHPLAQGIRVVGTAPLKFDERLK